MYENNYLKSEIRSVAKNAPSLPARKHHRGFIFREIADVTSFAICHVALMFPLMVKLVQRLHIVGSFLQNTGGFVRKNRRYT